MFSRLCAQDRTRSKDIAMTTQLMMARRGEITEEMRQVAADEGYAAQEIRERVAAGTVVIPRNRHREFRAVGIGEGLRTKVNANIGASGLRNLVEEEIQKLDMAVRYGADAVMDLSTGADLDAIRAELMKRSPVMLGTVPIYQVASEAAEGLVDAEKLFACIERQAEQGVDFMTVHCGITRRSLQVLESAPRLAGIVSRGGSLLANYIRRTGQENPLCAQFDRLCDIFAEHDVTFSLGDGLRPGATADASDAGQLAELMELGELAARARARGCQVMIEGPGHVPLHLVEANVQLEKRLCGGAPFYVLGPIVTDVSPGYDHIAAAIGGALAAASGADFLCYVTPAEHLRLPDVQDVVDGVVATRLAAHSGDLVKGVPGAKAWDDAMSGARRDLDWEAMYSLAMDPWKARRLKEGSEAAGEEVCSMCGELCAVRMDRRSREAEAAGAGPRAGATADPGVAVEPGAAAEVRAAARTGRAEPEAGGGRPAPGAGAGRAEPAPASAPDRTRPGK
jgi:phosphomethylpyrimidine synthase